MTAALGWIVAALIAVGGWIASGYLARRGDRRKLRIEYLLSAYRRLDAMSNRDMTSQHELDLESAISDIQLLGTPAQIALADELARAFVDTRSAVTGPLLERLRRDLRRELTLEDVPPRMLWLRVNRGSRWTEEAAAIQARLPRTDDAARHDSNSDHATDAAPDDADAILAVFAELEDDLRESLRRNDVEVSGASFDELVDFAFEIGAISDSTRRSLVGMRVLRDLAQKGLDSVDDERVAEYKTMAGGLEWILHNEVTNSDPPPREVNS